MHKIILLFPHHFVPLWNAHLVLGRLWAGFSASGEFLAFPPSSSESALASTRAEKAALCGLRLQHDPRSFALQFVNLDKSNKSVKNSPLSSSNSFSNDWISSSRNFSTWQLLFNLCFNKNIKVTKTFWSFTPWIINFYAMNHETFLTHLVHINLRTCSTLRIRGHLIKNMITAHQPEKDWCGFRQSVTKPIPQVGVWNCERVCVHIGVCCSKNVAGGPIIFLHRMFNILCYLRPTLILGGS